MAAIQQDAFQIMMSAKSIDQSEFAEQDKAAFQQHWNKVFVNKLVSAHIYDAISAKSAASSGKQSTVSVPGGFAYYRSC